MGPVIAKYSLAGGRHQVAMTFLYCSWERTSADVETIISRAKYYCTARREIQRSSATNAFIPLNNAREIYQFFLGLLIVMS